jgi:hypothetical protein
VLAAAQVMFIHIPELQSSNKTKPTAQNARLKNKFRNFIAAYRSKLESWPHDYVYEFRLIQDVNRNWYPELNERNSECFFGGKNRRMKHYLRELRPFNMRR